MREFCKPCFEKCAWAGEMGDRLTGLLMCLSNAAEGAPNVFHPGAARDAKSHMSSNPNCIMPRKLSICVKENLLVGDVNEFSSHNYNSSARINRARDRVREIETEPREIPRTCEISR